MKKKYILLILMVLLLLSGCKKREEYVPKKESTECVTIEDTEEKEVEEPLETSPKEEEENKVTSEQTEHKEHKEEQEEIPQTPDKADTTEKVVAENHTSQESIPQESENTSKPVKDYNPNKIVMMATDKLKAKGKVTLTDNLDRLLAEGSITQEEYNEYYPYDGAGYYSVFMETNLYDAKTTSGRKLSSEEEIAEHIAEMLALEPGPYFLIEYAGVYTTGGNDFYEFRCYRA